jgi:hypothetical protein
MHLISVTNWNSNIRFWKQNKKVETIKKIKEKRGISVWAENTMVGPYPHHVQPKSCAPSADLLAGPTHQSPSSTTTLRPRLEPLSCGPNCQRDLRALVAIRAKRWGPGQPLRWAPVFPPSLACGSVWAGRPVDLLELVYCNSRRAWCGWATQLA